MRPASSLRNAAAVFVAWSVAACGDAGGTDVAANAPNGAAGASTSAGGAQSSGGSSTGGASTGTGGATSAGGATASGGTSAGGTSNGGATSGGGAGPSGGNGSAGGPPCAAGTIVCDGNTAETCDGNGGLTKTEACMIQCTPGVGCAVCQPGTGTCNGNVATFCKADGSGTITNDCGAQPCMNGICTSPCASPGTLKRTYIGCDYFPTVTSNMGLYQGFSFAAVVANTTAVTANVQITRGTTLVAAGSVAPHDVATFKLPWVDELRHHIPSFTLPSALVKTGAYHLAADQPVTVYQFNPLEYQIPQDGFCPDLQLSGGCYSYTNDASLLLPVNALGTSYLVASRGSRATVQTDANGNMLVTDIPGLLAVTAVADGTTVTVTASAFVRGGTGVQKMTPGSTQSFAMNAGDVLQLLTDTPTMSDVVGCASLGDGTTICDVPKTYDLTGTRVESDKPVTVVGGHDCDNVPYDHAACDHLEEVMFPLSTWGTDAIVTPPQSVVGAPQNDGTADPHVVRILSGQDGNTITLDPPVPGANVGTLNAGEWVDLPQTSEDLAVHATGPVLVAQYMLGGDLVDPNDHGAASRGDPSLSLAIPTSQYRTDYTFLAPASYASSFVNVIAPAGANVTLDGAPLGGTPAAIGASGYTVVRKAVSGAAHTMTGDMPFGIVVYGYGSYTSYMYPGGLDLETQ